MTDIAEGASDDGGFPMARVEQPGEPGQEQPALEDRQPSADQDDVLATDVESEQTDALAEGAEPEQEPSWTRQAQTAL